MDEQATPSTAVPAFDVTVLPPLGELLEGLTDQLAAWLPIQRWYAHKGTGAPAVSIRGWAPLRVAPDHLVLATVLAATPPGHGESLYQVPVVLRHADRTSERTEPGAEIGVLAVPGGPVRVDDATRDTDGRETIMSVLRTGDGGIGPGLHLAPHTVRDPAELPAGAAVRSRLLAGEQSNTSMILEADGAAPVIIKLFRVLQHGQNPDVVLQGALAAQGSRRIPPLVGSAVLATGEVRTHALFAQEFLPGVEDAWRTTRNEAIRGADFSGRAADLGATVAEVHRDLARALGTVPTDASLAAAMVGQMRERIDQVAATVPQVDEHRRALETLMEAALEVTWPDMQRIHGDLHLGQVLSDPELGWVLLDFEGEPLRPLEQRSRADSPLRDVAGMLRSIDYAAGAVAHERGIDATDWAERARSAFLDGYVRQAPIRADDDALRVLLAAFEADKAVYEALYEARNRPDWLPIPLGALERISAAAGAAGSAG